MTNIQFQLNPSIPYINVMATQGWFYVQYPSGLAYWVLQDVNGNILIKGNYIFSQEVLTQWTTSDKVLIDDLLATAPWDIKPAIVEVPVEVLVEEPVTPPTE